MLLWVNAAPLSCYSIGQDSRGGKVGPDIMNAYRSSLNNNPPKARKERVALRRVIVTLIIRSALAV